MNKHPQENDRKFIFTIQTLYGIFIPNFLFVEEMQIRFNWITDFNHLNSYRGRQRERTRSTK